MMNDEFHEVSFFMVKFRFMIFDSHVKIFSGHLGVIVSLFRGGGGWEMQSSQIFSFHLHHHHHIHTPYLLRIELQQATA